MDFGPRTCGSLQKQLDFVYDSAVNWCPPLNGFSKDQNNNMLGATQTETSLLKQYVAGERVDLLDEYLYQHASAVE